MRVFMEKGKERPAAFSCNKSHVKCSVTENVREFLQNNVTDRMSVSPVQMMDIVKSNDNTGNIVTQNGAGEPGELLFKKRRSRKTGERIHACVENQILFFPFITDPTEYIQTPENQKEDQSGKKKKQIINGQVFLCVNQKNECYIKENQKDDLYPFKKNVRFHANTLLSFKMKSNRIPNYRKKGKKIYIFHSGLKKIYHSLVSRRIFHTGC